MRMFYLTIFWVNSDLSRWKLQQPNWHYSTINLQNASHYVLGPPGMLPPQPLPPPQQPPGPLLFGPPGQLLGSGPGGAYMQGSNFQFEDMPYEEEEVELRRSNCATCECGPEFCGENYINVDRFFLVAMPLLFLVFNVVYWFAYGSHYFISTSEEVFITDVD